MYVLLRCAVSLLLLCGLLCAADVELSWSVRNPTNVIGYRLTYESESGVGTSIDVGLATKFTVDNLTLGRTYYFKVEATSKSGDARSSEVVKVKIAAPPEPEKADRPKLIAKQVKK